MKKQPLRLPAEFVVQVPLKFSGVVSNVALTLRLATRPDAVMPIATPGPSEVKLSETLALAADWLEVEWLVLVLVLVLIFVLVPVIVIVLVNVLVIVLVNVLVIVLVIVEMPVALWARGGMVIARPTRTTAAVNTIRRNRLPPT